jgi:hypothetical protein
MSEEFGGTTPGGVSGESAANAQSATGSGQTPELQQLIAALTEGDLTENQFRQLESMLASDPAARAAYYRQLQSHSLLMFSDLPALGVDPQLNSAEEFAEFVSRASNQAAWRGEPLGDVVLGCTALDELQAQTSGCPAVSTAPTDFSDPSPFYGFLASRPGINWPSLLFLLLLALLVGIVGTAAWRQDRKDAEIAATDGAVNKQAPSRPAVAYLTSVNGCYWGSPSQNNWLVGRSIQSSDELVLHEGIAEFNLSSGVTLSIEGPAALMLTSPSSLVVHFGKVTVHVPWTVTDFKMLASSCPISACDAGFGVNVLGSTIDLHVFSGEVIVGSSPFGSVATDEWEYGSENVPIQREEDLPAGSEFIKARVLKGRGLMLSDGDGSMKVSRWHSAKAAEFAAKLSMAGPLPVTDSYVQNVIKSKPVGYWRFESQEEKRIVNQVSPSNDLHIVGNVKLIGDQENRVAEFGRSRSEGHMVSSKPFDALAEHDYSVEFWIKPSHSHRGGLIGLAVNQHLEPGQVGSTNLHGFFLEIVGALKPAALVELGLKEPNSIRFLHRDPPGSGYRLGTSCFSGTPYVVRRWQHVVAVKAGSELRLYLNGKLTATGKDESFLAKGLYLEVGQLIGAHEILPFVGQMDELSVYNRALPPAEIKRHYKTIDWTTKKPPAATNVEAKTGNGEA